MILKWFSYGTLIFWHSRVELGLGPTLDSSWILIFFSLAWQEIPGRGRSGSDPPPEGGCPRCPHEFSCSRTPKLFWAAGLHRGHNKVHAAQLREAQGCQPPDTVARALPSRPPASGCDYATARGL